ncbi:MAG: hypothetical protein ACD_20C00391G0007 [uncultured bacterium]|nr:MAG: hypothetical protein ACD_20C00391G0007 [uncultured bacterium]HBH18717.1 hypothetical protein [Cyanobacteria bacterium UBA9579]
MQNPLSNKTIEKLKYDLVRDGLLSYESLSKAEEIAKGENKNLAQVLIQSNLIPEQDLLGFIEAKLHIPYVNLDDYTIDKSCLSFISRQEAQGYRIIPLFKIEDVLTIAMADPLDLFLMNNLINCINCKIEPIICSERSILEAIDKHYSSDNSDNFEYKSADNIEFDWRQELNNENHDNIQAQKIIQAIIYQAITEKVQEIFLENTTNGIIVKFRKNNELQNKGDIPVLLTSLIISNLKVMSNLDPSIIEVPQLGKLEILLQSNKIIVNVASFPTANGERISLKIYQQPKKLEELGINTEELDLIKSGLAKSGIILICSTDLNLRASMVYSLLSSLNAADKNIMTVESAIKYELAGVNQCELNEKVGFSIDKAIKFIDFQSPDIIYLEDALTKTGIEFILFLVQAGKIVITDNSADENILNNPYFKELSSFISCMVFAQNNTIKVITKKDQLN